MNNTFSSEQLRTTGDLNFDLIKRRLNLDKVAKLMEIKSINPKLKKSQTAKELALSNSTLQRYRRRMNMNSTCRIYRKLQLSNTHIRKQNASNHTGHDLKMTSK